MEPLLIVKDRDIFPNEAGKEDLVYELRLAVKAVIVDLDGKIALVGKKYRLLPGGGVEEGETFIDAIKRECREEVGCNIEIDKEIGFTEEYRSKIGRHQQTHFFLARILGEKGSPETIEDHEQGIEVNWYHLDDAVLLLEKQILEIPYASYHSCFNVRTHLLVLKELKKSSL